MDDESGGFMEGDKLPWEGKVPGESKAFHYFPES